jgi:predicted acyltransferase
VLTDTPDTPDAPARLRSLDVLRGMAVAGMILVEQTVGPPRSYPALRHASWNGWTAADLVFPAFLVAVGASLAFSLKPPVTWTTARRLAKRVIALLVLGVLFNAWSGDGASFDFLRVPGVLQRIAVAGGLAAVIVLVGRVWWVVLIVAVALLALYGAMLTGGHTDCGRGVLTPHCSITGSVDRQVFGADHMYQRGFAGYDPEGLLSTLGATATVSFGYVGARLVRMRPRVPRTAVEVAGVALGLWVASGVLWQGSPINKKLWSPPFALFTAAVTLAVFALVYLLVDVLPRAGRSGDKVAAVAAWPWAVLGRNALVVYIGQHVLASTLDTTHVHTAAGVMTLNQAFTGQVLTHWWSGEQLFLAHALVVLAGFWVVAIVMHAMDWHVSV